MAPSVYVPVNGSIIPASGSASETPETITNIVFGLCALAIGGLTIWQGRKAWKMWMNHAAARGGAEEGMDAINETLHIQQPELQGSSILSFHEKLRLTAFYLQILKRHLMSWMSWNRCQERLPRPQNLPAVRRRQCIVIYIATK